MTTFETLKFDNQALKRLPIDPEKDNFGRQVIAGFIFHNI